jgi:very-short-patch-repair endonuclease
MYESGMSAYEVADHFGVSEGVIRKRLRLWGEHIRDYGESTTVRLDRTTEAERIEHGRLISEALKGKAHSYEHRCALAKAREVNITHVGRGEKKIGEILSGHGFNITPQKAVGKYNVDIAINEHRIAVEVFTGLSWLTSSKKGYAEKFKYLVNSGWKPIIVCFSNGQPEVVKIKNNLIACLDILCLNRATSCHYPVIWCKRKSVATVYADVEDWPAVLRSYRTQSTGC